MVGEESFEGGLEDGADGVAVQGGRFGEFVAVVVGDASDEVDTLRVGIRRVPRSAFHLFGERTDVAAKELAEAVEQEGMDGRMFAMPGAEGTEGGEKAVGEGSAIDFLDDGGLGLVCLVEEEVAEVFGQLLLEDVTHEPFADVGTAAFVAENVAEGRNGGVEGASVVVAGVAASAKNGDDAGLPLAESSCCTEHVALHVDVGILADGLMECLHHDGCFLRGASSAIKVDGGD